MRATNVIDSFRYAIDGLGHLFRTQRNARIHAALGTVVIVCGALFHIERLEWVAVAGVITLMLVVEGLNTAIEAVVDLVSPTYHRYAKIAKDVAAGAVLLSALGAIIVGALIFLPRLWALLAP